MTKKYKYFFIAGRTEEAIIATPALCLFLLQNLFMFSAFFQHRIMNKDKEENNIPEAEVITCTVCGEQYDSADALQDHICISHLRWLPYQCGFCNENGVETYKTTEKGIKMHLEAVHESLFNVIYNGDEKNETDLKNYMDGSIYGEEGTGLVNVKVETCEVEGTVSEFDNVLVDKSPLLGGIGIVKSEEAND